MACIKRSRVEMETISTPGSNGPIREPEEERGLRKKGWIDKTSQRNVIGPDKLYLLEVAKRRITLFRFRQLQG